MADVTITGLTALTSVDRAADYFEVADASDSGNSFKTTVNNMLDVTSHPVGISDSQTLTNKTITTPTLTVNDDSFTLQDNSDTTKKLQFQLSGITTATTRTLTIPNVSDTLVTLTASQTLTNKTLTSPTITSATISNPTLTVDTVSEYTSANGVTIDGVLLKDAKMNGSYLTDGSVANTQLANGVVVQVVGTNYGNYTTGTTTIPLDTTIPQITEGNEYMTQAITPKSATNILIIRADIYCAHSVACDMIAALFQDATANALAAVSTYQTAATGRVKLTLFHKMTAGTTSSTTFRIRAGGSSAGTFYFNSVSYFGGITLSGIEIMEYKA